jgi:hypothetical protein
MLRELKKLSQSRLIGVTGESSEANGVRARKSFQTRLIGSESQVDKEHHDVVVVA